MEGGVPAQGVLTELSLGHFSPGIVTKVNAELTVGAEKALVFCFAQVEVQIGARRYFGLTSAAKP